MDPRVQFSRHAGELRLVEVPGVVELGPNPENEVEVRAGEARSMYVYAPLSGCPHPKQTQVLFVLRDGADERGARAALRDLGLDALSERDGVIVVLPNPAEGGWNYGADASRESDVDLFARCFSALGPATGVAGFNGMMSYLACSPEASSMVWTLATERPLDVCGMMVGPFAEGYRPPEGALAPQVCWLYGDDEATLERLVAAGGAVADGRAGETRSFSCPASPAVRVLADGCGLSSETVAEAWDVLLSRVRRWRDDVWGTHRERVDFEGRGFVPHVDDLSLGLGDSLPRTWYEYVPARLRETSEPVPLVIYFHGINCMGLYGAEQSGWADVADRDGFMVAFPNATVDQRWNAWDDARLPDDVGFVLALIEHMAQVHELDRSRVYLSGFSMGSMFAQALACSRPGLFAGVIACNAPNMAYLQTLDEAAPGLLKVGRRGALSEIPPRPEESSVIRAMADGCRDEGRFGMPVVQFVGLEDGLGFPEGERWPVTPDGGDLWVPTIGFWMAFNGFGGAGRPSFDGRQPTGVASDRTVREGRFVHQSWELEGGGGTLRYHLVAVERLPHAVDPRELEIGWEIVRKFSRSEDGSLTEGE